MKTLSRKAWNHAAAAHARALGEYALTMEHWGSLDRSKAPAVAVSHLLLTLVAQNMPGEPAKAAPVVVAPVLDGAFLARVIDKAAHEAPVVEDNGRGPCGFAEVLIYDVDGRTAKARHLRAAGFDVTRGTARYWVHLDTQSVDAKVTVARHIADALGKHAGLDAHVRSWLD